MARGGLLNERADDKPETQHSETREEASKKEGELTSGGGRVGSGRRQGRGKNKTGCAEKGKGASSRMSRQVQTQG